MCNIEDNQSKYSFLSTSSTVKSEDIPFDHPTQYLSTSHECKGEIPNNGIAAAAPASKSSMSVQQPYRNENTEVYINCVRSMSRFNERWHYNNKQPKLFYFYERSYKEKDTSCRKNNYDHWNSVKSNYIHNNTKYASQYIGNKNYFSALSKSQFASIHKSWKMQIPTELSKSRSCSAVFDYQKLYPFKDLCEPGLPAYRKNS